MRISALFLLCAVAAVAGLERPAAAATTIVFDPAPLTGSRSSDFPETATGVSESYQFAGSARNDGASPVQLILHARASGSDVVGSEQVFVIPPTSNTAAFNYNYTLPGPIPTSVGLTFSASAPLTFVAGPFTFGPAPPVPAAPWPVLALLAVALLLLAARRLRTRNAG
jgi:hypothetical protein